ncbi:hypothetical protein B0H11DRAFT_1916283 [Mycena galericulata]|nr:hypothetical protein B0H11DRAFT_1916283 [Mycena galericulata]
MFRYYGTSLLMEAAVHASSLMKRRETARTFSSIFFRSVFWIHLRTGNYGQIPSTVSYKPPGYLSFAGTIGLRLDGPSGPSMPECQEMSFFWSNSNEARAPDSLVRQQRRSTSSKNPVAIAICEDTADMVSSSSGLRGLLALVSVHWMVAGILFASLQTISSQVTAIPDLTRLTPNFAIFSLQLGEILHTLVAFSVEIVVFIYAF